MLRIDFLFLTKATHKPKVVRAPSRPNSDHRIILVFPAKIDDEPETKKVLKPTS